MLLRFNYVSFLLAKSALLLPIPCVKEAVQWVLCLLFGEPGVTANQVQDKFKVLLQSELICQSLMTPQGVACSSSEPTTVSTTSMNHICR